MERRSENQPKPEPIRMMPKQEMYLIRRQMFRPVRDGRTIYDNARSQRRRR